jgi:hypothetical protein
VADGRVVGVWEPADGIAVTLFSEAGPVSRSALEAEAERLTALTGGSPAVVLQVD